MSANWKDIQSDYENKNMEPGELVEKYNVSILSIKDKIEKESWLHNAEALPEDREIRTRRILALSDRMLDKVQLALGELDKCVIKSKERIKEVEYDDELKKPISEKNIETETVVIRDSLIDTGALKQLVSTLKDIKDIQTGIDGAKSEDSDESGVILISDINSDREEETA